MTDDPLYRCYECGKLKKMINRYHQCVDCWASDPKSGKWKDIRYKPDYKKKDNNI